ncbi:uncharacterized protein E6C27_scaffold134G00220 [Cucumis melo var. makuwa]|uniref:Transmembrane protein n=2 Tax=Cucumis melo TaxID=3656 RepID=A0A5A7SNT0_CUCMM|nr:uncharacterized protein E6C27_scaffold134G00220 [Cucumis melo var. makuwa]
MEVQQSWRLRFSFRNATIALCFLNLVAAFLLLQGFLSAASSRSRPLSTNQKLDQLKYIREAQEIRLSMQPLELIKRVREIQEEAYYETEAVQDKDSKQNAAIDLSKRLKDFRSLNDASSLKALEEWRKRKMERARLREMEKNGTLNSPSQLRKHNI